MRAGFLCACAALVWACPVFAQDLPLTDQDKGGKTGPDRVASSIANGPNESPLDSKLVPELQLVATGDEKTASLSWSFTQSPSSPSTSGKLWFDQFTLTLTSELEKPDTDATLLGLGGFPGGTQIALNWTHFSGAISYPGRPFLDAAKAKANQACREKNNGLGEKELDKTCDVDRIQKGSVTSYFEEYNREGYEDLLRFSYNGPIKFYGIRAAGSQDVYKYLDAASFAQKKDSKFSYSGTAFAGLLGARGPWAVTASFTWSRQFDAQPPITLCQPVTAQQTQCITAPNGAPDQTSKAIAAIEGRFGFGLTADGNLQFAIAPRFAYDAKNDGYSAELPIYLAGDGKGKLRGGVRIVHSDERDPASGGRKRDTQVGFFVGVPFSLFTK